MPKKKNPLEPTPRRTRAYELPNLVNVRGTQDPIRDIENEALRDLSNDYRRLRIEEMIQKKRAQLEKSSPSSDISMQKQNLDIVGSIVKIAKELSPSSGKDQTLEYLRFFNEITQNQGGKGSSFFESMVQDPALYQRTQEIFSGGRSGTTNTSDIEIEKLRGERMLSGKKIDLEIFKMRLENELRASNMGIIANILGPILSLGGAQVARTMQQKGMEMGQGHLNPGAPASSQDSLRGILQGAGLIKPDSLQGQTGEMLIKCYCGYNKIMLVPDPPPKILNCPGCGQPLETSVGIPSITDEEAGAQWKQHQ